MSAQSTKKAIKTAYEKEIEVAFKHFVDALATAGSIGAEQEAARDRFRRSLEVAGDAFAQANRIVGGS